VALLKLSEVEDLAELGTTFPKRSFHHLGLSPMRPNELWTCLDDGATMAQAPGCQGSSCWVRSQRKRRGLVMMMISFITIKSSLVPLMEGLCAQIYFRSEKSVVCSHLLRFFFGKEKIC